MLLASLQTVKVQIRVVNVLKGRAAVQLELDRLEKCAGRNLVKFSEGRWQVLRLIE